VIDFGSEFQVVSAECRKTRFANSVLVKGWIISGTSDERNVSYLQTTGAEITASARAQSTTLEPLSDHGRAMIQPWYFGIVFHCFAK